MKKCLLFLASFFCLTFSYSQVVLIFKGQWNSVKQVSLDRIVIENKSKGWVETLNYPDTIAVLTQGSGIKEESAIDFVLNQNVPNPFEESTIVSLCVPEAGNVELEMYDLSGKKVSGYSAYFTAGKHQFRVSAKSPQTYMLTAHYAQQTVSIKMISAGYGSANQITYDGTQPINMSIKKNLYRAFDYGDLMTYKGYIELEGEDFGSEVVEKQQIVSEYIDLNINTFKLDGNPCIGKQKTVTDIDNNVYNTVQIGSQCWMKENLRTTKYADGTPIDQGNSTSTTMAYWYYPNNNESNKATYGLLYNWKAVMGSASSSNTNPSGVQGICPNGWHVPSDAEWTQLTDYVSSQNQYVCGSNASYIAKALASNTGWEETDGTCAVGNDQSNNNALGFGALPAGYYGGRYDIFGIFAYFWSATESGAGAFGRYLCSRSAVVVKTAYSQVESYSVRCLRD